MATSRLEHITIIGVGLLGGSVALAVKALDAEVRIAGVGRRRVSLDKALDVGAIDTAHLDAAEVGHRSDLVILATPVGAFAKHLRTIAPLLKPKAIVTDVGSTKSMVVRQAAGILGRSGRFVGSHPMAGSERKGVAFARADLFGGATCILTPTSSTPPSVTRRLKRFWSQLGMTVRQMTPGAHDKAMARISHFPHVLAGLLMLLPDKADLEVAATGFRDTTRLASGDPEMWRDILLTNRKAILAGIDAFDEQLMHLRDLLIRADAPGVEKFLTAAKRRRDATVAKLLPDLSTSE